MGTHQLLHVTLAVILGGLLALTFARSALVRQEAEMQQEFLGDCSRISRALNARQDESGTYQGAPQLEGYAGLYGRLEVVLLADTVAQLTSDVGTVYCTPSGLSRQVPQTPQAPHGRPSLQRASTR